MEAALVKFWKSLGLDPNSVCDVLALMSALSTAAYSFFVWPQHGWEIALGTTAIYFGLRLFLRKVATLIKRFSVANLVEQRTYEQIEKILSFWPMMPLNYCM